MRALIPLALILAAAACAPRAPDPGATTGSAARASADAPDRSPLPSGRSGNLPANLWTTRLGGNRIEATVSDGLANLGVACVAGAEIALRLHPAEPLPAGETTVTLASRGVRVGLPMTPDGSGNLRATLPASSLLTPVLAAVAGGAPLSVRIGAETGGPVFAPLGAEDALETALRPGGCRA